MNNTFKVLDEGRIRKLKYKEYQMVPEYVTEWYNQMKICSKCFNALADFDYSVVITREDAEIWERWKGDTFAECFYIPIKMDDPKKLSAHTKKTIAEKLGYIPFIPCVMFNISPAWKGEFGKNELTDKLMIKNFCKVIDSYLNESFQGNKRYSKYKYCLECGSEGDFLHAHIVAEINPKITKSTKTHIMKGNHSQQLKKSWNKIFKGHQGLLKGKYSVQRNLINSEEILADKLKYLHEENKEEGHQNLRDLNVIIGGF